MIGESNAGLVRGAAERRIRHSLHAVVGDVFLIDHMNRLGGGCSSDGWPSTVHFSCMVREERMCSAGALVQIKVFRRRLFHDPVQNKSSYSYWPPAGPPRGGARAGRSRRACRRAAQRSAHRRKSKPTEKPPAAQQEINAIRDRTQDAAGRYAQAMADAESLERFNAQLDEQVQVARGQRSLRSNSSCSTSRRPTAKFSRSCSRWSTRSSSSSSSTCRSCSRSARRASQGLKDMMSRADVDDLREVPPHPRGVSDRARVRPHARRVRRPPRHRRRRAHGRVRPARPRLVDVSHARWLGDGLLGRRPERLGSLTRATARPSKKPLRVARKDGAPIC